jgi:hypothetical protein
MNEGTTAVTVFVRIPDETGAYADVPSWFSTTTAYPAEVMALPAPADLRYDATILARPYLTWRTAVVPRTIRPTYKRVPGMGEDLRAQPVSAEDLAAWARSMMGADDPDMLDI